MKKSTYRRRSLHSQTFGWKGEECHEGVAEVIGKVHHQDEDNAFYWLAVFFGRKELKVA